MQIDKVVHHYLLRATGGDVALHDHEYDLVGWYGVNEALRLMTYDNEAHRGGTSGTCIEELLAGSSHGATQGSSL
ncbi:MAG: hypothetical protein U0360_06180 [Dehalococcoidia bacterium]